MSAPCVRGSGIGPLAEHDIATQSGTPSLIARRCLCIMRWRRREICQHPPACRSGGVVSKEFEDAVGSPDPSCAIRRVALRIATSAR